MSWPAFSRLIVIALALHLSAADAVVPAPAEIVHVPCANGELSLDGSLDEKAWLGSSGRTGVFRAASGEPGRPHAEARFLWSESALYVGLYAADSDIRSSRAGADGPRWIDGDTIELLFTTPDGSEVRIEVSPDGTISDARRAATGWDYSWQSGARAGHDADGTLDDPSDEDEEWVIEMAIPLNTLGLAGRNGSRIDLAIRRCDVVSKGPRTCTSWGQGGSAGVLELDSALEGSVDARADVRPRFSTP